MHNDIGNVQFLIAQSVYLARLGINNHLDCEQVFLFISTEVGSEDRIISIS